MTSEIIRLKIDRDFSLMPWLLPASVRADVRALGRFVRLADTVALSPLASREDRQVRLAALLAALGPPGIGEPPPLLPDDAAAIEGLRASIHRHAISTEHARTILLTLQRAAAAANPPDGRSAGSASWAEVLTYCRGVAAPVGRHMLALCREDATTCGPPADALCSALRILKELRDGNAGGGPWLCIPASFMRDASISPTHLAAPSARGQTRAVLDRVLDGVDALLAEAERLPALVAGRRLRLYVCVVLCRARKLAQQFRLRDPLQEKVGLSRWQRHGCLVLSVPRGGRRP